VTSRGAAQAPIFADDADRAAFVVLLYSVVRRFTWKCHIYCLMTNHFHLVVETERERLSAGMHRLNGNYARHFNERHDRCGHLFQDRYGAYLIDCERHLANACTYVAENPVRAGLCGRAEDWPWSGSLVGA
jgi:REP element-mobilizing transposase RayT